jgi:hypothetical protein
MKNRYQFLSERTVDAVIVQLKKHGIALVPNYLSSNVLKKLNLEFERSLTENSLSVYARSKHPTNTRGKAARLNPWHKEAMNEFPEISSVFRDEFMRDIAQSFYAPYPFIFNEAVFITNEFPCEVPILPWHFDRVQSLKFWFNLTDTTKHNGAFEYCPGTHWEGRYRAGYYLSQGVGIEDLPNDIDEDLIRNPVTLELKAGDLLIFDPDGFHRGGIVEEGGERRVLRAHTYPKGRRYGDKLFSAGWWIRSPLNLNRWFKSSTSRILGDRIQETSVNRKLHNIAKEDYDPIQ